MSVKQQRAIHDGAKINTAFVHLLCYLIIPYPNKTHRSDNLFINAAIMQLATYGIDVTIEQPSFGQKVGQCSSAKCDVTTALVHQNDVTKS